MLARAVLGQQGGTGGGGVVLEQSTLITGTPTSIALPAGTDLLVVLSAYPSTFNTLSWTWNGDALTQHAIAQVDVNNSGLGQRAYIHYLIAPDVGTYNLVRTGSATSVALAFSGADQTTPLDTATTLGQSNNNDISQTVASTAGGIAVDVMRTRGAVTPAAGGSPQSVIFSGTGYGFSQQPGAAGTVTFTWSGLDGNRQAWAGVTINPS
jgi:hypothetical protein